MKKIVEFWIFMMGYWEFGCGEPYYLIWLISTLLVFYYWQFSFLLFLFFQRELVDFYIFCVNVLDPLRTQYINWWLCNIYPRLSWYINLAWELEAICICMNNFVILLNITPLISLIKHLTTDYCFLLGISGYIPHRNCLLSNGGSNER